jgi:ribosomal protein L29
MNKAMDEIRGHDTAELKVKLDELRKEQFEVRLRSSNEGPSSARASTIRRTIARILTVIGDRTNQQAGEQN